MKLTSATEHTLTLTDDDRREIAEALAEALDELYGPQAGLPYNWRSNPHVLEELYETLKPAGWGSLHEPQKPAPPPYDRSRDWPGSGIPGT